MRIVTEIIQRTYCECGAELFSADDWSRHNRQHMLEYWNATPERRRILQMTEGCLKEPVESRR